jgi:acyl-CoA thioesterase II
MAFPALTPVRIGFRDLIGLRPLGETCFQAPAYPEYPAERLFGGQLIAQALYAAGRTVPPGLLPHSLHAYFLKPAVSAEPVDYRVALLKQGRNLSARRVDAQQAGRTVFTLTASFGPDHLTADQTFSAWPSQFRLGPEDCRPDPAFAGAPLPTFPATDDFELRFPWAPSAGPRAFHPCWVRARTELGDDLLLRACAVAFVSDMGVLSGCVPAEEAAAAYGGASLDHAVWFGSMTRLEEWHLFELQPLLRTGRRGFGQGCLRAAAGPVAAVVAQEGYFEPA